MCVVSLTGCFIEFKTFFFFSRLKLDTQWECQRSGQKTFLRIFCPIVYLFSIFYCSVMFWNGRYKVDLLINYGFVIVNLVLFMCKNVLA